MHHFKRYFQLILLDLDSLVIDIAWDISVKSKDFKPSYFARYYHLSFMKPMEICSNNKKHDNLYRIFAISQLVLVNIHHCGALIYLPRKTSEHLSHGVIFLYVYSWKLWFSLSNVRRPLLSSWVFLSNCNKLIDLIAKLLNLLLSQNYLEWI